jgi:membrane associated rhomboid family serine protease
MGAMLPPQPDDPRPTTPTIESCYRHPDVQTGVHCTRCGRPICPSCMIPAAVGYQCPECVEQARMEYRRGPGSLRRRARSMSVTRALLAAIIVMFLVEIAASPAASLFGGPSPETLLKLGAMAPWRIADGEYWRLISAMFLHADLFHILFNGYALWIFGQAVENEYGSAWMGVLFFVTGFLASVTSYAFGPFALGVGASGAIFGLFGAFIAYNYRRRHLALASARLRSAIGLIVLNALLAILIPFIDWRAHLGGLVAGFVAGWIVEGVGPRNTRPVVRVVGLSAMVGLGIALVMWRTDQIRTLLGIL